MLRGSCTVGSITVLLPVWESRASVAATRPAARQATVPPGLATAATKPRTRPHRAHQRHTPVALQGSPTVNTLKTQ